MKIVKSDKFRSSNKVNQEYDMIRVTIDMTTIEFLKLKSQIEKENNMILNYQI
jgi:hypothetical protein